MSVRVVSISVEGRALVAIVEHTALDGAQERQQLSWTADTSRAAVEISIKDAHRRWLASRATPQPIHPAMDLVGTELTERGPLDVEPRKS